MMLDRTFLETRLAVGPFGCSFGYGSVRPTVTTRVSQGNTRSYPALTCDSDRDDDEQVNIQELELAMSA